MKKSSFEPYGVNNLSGEHSCKEVVYRKVSSANFARIMRHFPSSYLRTGYKQVGIRSKAVPIFNSDDSGLGDIVGSKVTVTGAGFPLDFDEAPAGGRLSNAEIFFDTDNYTTGYIITNSTSDTISVTPAPGNATGVKWVVRAIPLDEHIQISEIDVDFEVMGEPSGIDYTSGRGGENAD